MNIDFSSWADWKSWETLTEIGIAFGIKLAGALAIFFFGKWLSKRLVGVLRAALARSKVDATLAGFLGNVANIGLLVLVVVAALGQLGIPTTSITALIGGAGLAIALSLKDQLSNFAAGALIILFRPFKTGDYIKAGGFEGVVREIKMIQTSLRTNANEEVILPNSIVMGSSITNRSSLELCRVEVLVGVDYACDLKAAKAAVLKAAVQHPKSVEDKKPSSVQITNLGDNAIEITLWAWAYEEDRWALQCDLNEQVVENLREANINIPFPQCDVHIVSHVSQA